MHLITPYNAWAPKKDRTWQDEAWEQQQIAEIEAQRENSIPINQELPQPVDLNLPAQKSS